MGFHLRLAGGFVFELTLRHSAFISSLRSMLPSPSAWKMHCATAPCKSNSAMVSTSVQVELLWSL